MKGELKKVGPIAFLVGFLLALVVGILSAVNVITTSTLAGVYTILGILGLIVGFLNITDKEIERFLISSIAIIVGSGLLATSFSNLGLIATIITNFFTALVVFVAPAAILVSLITIYELAKD